MIRRSVSSRLVTGEAGSALIEVAVVSPVLLMMVFGILQFGVVMNTNVTLNDAVRVSSRTLALTRGTPDPCATAVTKLKNVAQGFTTASLNITVTVNGTAYGPSNSPSCSGQGTTMVTGADAAVEATYPCTAVIYGVDYMPSCRLRAKTVVRVE